MATVACDLDQTLYHFHDKVREAFFEIAVERNDKTILRGAYTADNEWRNLTDSVGENIAYEAIEKVHSNQWHHYPFDDSVETLQKISNKHEIIYITSRRKIHWEETKRWLANSQFPEGDLICTIENKLRYLKDCQYLIDDRPKTIIEFLYQDSFPEYIDAYKRVAFGLWESYNKNLTDVENVYLAPTWKCLAYYLKKKGVIE